MIPCKVCGVSREDNEIEPRFGYSICVDHAKLSPVQACSPARIKAVRAAKTSSTLLKIFGRLEQEEE